MLLIDGASGLGKSTLLRETLSRARDFQSLATQGRESVTPAALSVLREWAPDQDLPAEPFQAAQRLRAVVDRLQLTGPALLAVDDLQWIDDDSVQAIAWLLRRSDADRLLVVAATRPGSLGGHPLADSGAVVQRIELTGLSRSLAATLVRTIRPDADDELVDRLRRHTAGHPLHLRSIATEYSPAELARMEQLPAPADLVRAVTERLSGLSPDSVALAQAVALLGPDWVPLVLAIELAGPPDPTTALQVLTDEGLIESRPTGAGTELRSSHSLTGAAIYQQIAPAHRRDLHLAAAELVRARPEALRHRVAAVDRFDDDLADELEDVARQAHRSGDYRYAATFLRWSSEVSRQRADRERRWLDGLFDSVLARDLGTVSDQAGDVAWASDPVRRALVQGAALMAGQRWVPAVESLESPPAADVARTDPTVRHRLHALLAWSLATIGAPIARIVAALEAADECPEPDPAMAGYLQLARGHLRMRIPGQWERWAMVADAPADPKAVAGPALAWRGTVFVLGGRLDEGVADLHEFVGRVQDGTAGFGDGAFHAVLGYGQWLRGARVQARIPIGVAVESRPGAAQPLVRAIAPLRTIDGDGREPARRQLTEAFDDIRAAQPAIRHVAGVVAGIIELLDGDADRQRALLPHLRRGLGEEIAELEGPVSPLWELHLGLAAAWSGDLDLAVRAADRLDRAPAELAWRPAAVRWIRGQLALATGARDEARRLLGSAAAEGLTGLPFHQERLRAALAELTHGPSAPLARTAAAKEGAADPMTRLSDRERDVVSLLTEGLSYAQIARELYLSRSTVAFHLSNAYAKTNTGSRHELVALVRAAHR